MSPYELLLLGDPVRRLGLWAELRADAGILPAPSVGLAARLAAGGIGDLRLFVRDLPGRRVVFAYLTATADADGVPAALAAEPWWQALAARTGGWRRMEFMNLVAHPRVFPHRPGAAVRRLGLVAGLRPEREAAYRSLHQTNWPGVVERMVRSNYRAWTTFLTDDSDGLLLFTTVEYGGVDQAADDAAAAADPVTRRWWTHTEPCLLPLLPGGGNWTAMEPLPAG